jgi:hypothetical protein
VSQLKNFSANSDEKFRNLKVDTGSVSGYGLVS